MQALNASQKSLRNRSGYHYASLGTIWKLVFMRYFNCRFAFPAVACLAIANSSLAQNYNDGHGKEWRRLPSTLGLSWNQVATICPPGGTGPCTGTVGGRDLSGWTWATQQDVRNLFSYFVPDILMQPCIGGSQYTVAGVQMLGGGYIEPTFAFYSSFGASLYVNGWTSTANNGIPFLAAASAQYPVFDASFCVNGTAAADAVLNYTGVWLWRAIDCPLPAISSEPVSQSACRAATATFSTSATSATTLTCQWRKNASNINITTNPSAATATLNLPNIHSDDVGSYDCIIANSCGSRTTVTALLSVCVADFNCDGISDFFDYLDFVDAFSSNLPVADFNADGSIDFFDYLDFVDAFSTGC